jgi:hypothetical protein
MKEMEEVLGQVLVLMMIWTWLPTMADDDNDDDFNLNGYDNGRENRIGRLWKALMPSK